MTPLFGAIVGAAVAVLIAALNRTWAQIDVRRKDCLQAAELLDEYPLHYQRALPRPGQKGAKVRADEGLMLRRLEFSAYVDRLRGPLRRAGVPSDLVKELQDCLHRSITPFELGFCSWTPEQIDYITGALLPFTDTTDMPEPEFREAMAHILVSQDRYGQAVRACDQVYEVLEAHPEPWRRRFQTPVQVQGCLNPWAAGLP